MFSEYDHLRANLIIASAIYDHLTSAGDPLALDLAMRELDHADECYFAHPIVRKVMTEDAKAGA